MSYGSEVTLAPGGQYPVRQRGAGGTYVSNTSNTADEQLLTGSGQLTYWNMREVTGSAGAVVELYDGTSTGGQRICSIGMQSGVSDTHDFADGGIPVERGVFKHVVTGSALVTICVDLDIGAEG